jgi:HEAT repeat protein
MARFLRPLAKWRSGQVFSKLLNIRPDEWPRLSLLYVMNFVVLVGLYWGDVIVEAAFLRQVGVEFLPLLIMGNAACSIIAVVIYTAFADQVTNDKLLIAILGISVAGIAIGLVLLGWGLVTITYPLLYLVANVPLRDILNVHWATYVNGFYDTRAAKRIIPVLGSAVRIAGIVAGLTMPLLNHLLSPGGIIVLWLAAAVATALLTWLMPYLLGDRRRKAEGQPRTPGIQPSKFDVQRSVANVREGFRYVSQSPFLRWMALATLSLMILLAFVNYQTGKVLLARLNTVERISNFTGLLNGLSNLIALPFQLFLLSRLIGRMGLGNAAMIFPATTLVTCGGLIAAPGILTAGLGHLDRTTFRTTLRNPMDSLLYNAVPLRVKGRARAFIGGLVVPIGSLIGGLLLTLSRRPETTGGSVANWFLPAMIGALAVVYLASAWVIRRQYTQALITMLEQEDFSFLLSQEASDLTVTDPATLSRLREKLEQPDASPELKIFMAQLISQVGGSEAVPILSQAARSATDARVRSAILDVLAAAYLRGDAVRQLYVDSLADPDGRVRQSAIDGLEQLAGPTDKQFLSQMLEMVEDPNINVCTRALSALVRCGDFHQLTPAVQALDQLLADEDPHRRARGVRVLGQVGDERAIRRLVEYLTDPSDEVRLEATVALETLSQETMPGQVSTLVVEKMSSLLRDPVERVRQAALIVLGRIGTRESHQALVSALTDPSPQVRATAADALVQIGKSVIPVVHHELDSPDPQLRKMVTVILSRINPREFGALIVGSSITSNLLTIYGNYGLAQALTPCSGYPSIAVLQSALREQNQQLVDEIFYLLTAIHPPSAVNIIIESLRSEDPRTRANAVEALESLTMPQTAGLIAPLFEPDLPPAQLLSLSEDAWDMEHPDLAEAIQQLATHPDDPWLRTITTFALGEIGAALSPQAVIASEAKQSPSRKEEIASSQKPLLAMTRAEQLPPKKELPSAEPAAGKERKARRSPPSDLFGALIDPLEDAASQPEESTEEADRPSEQSPFTLPEIKAMLAVSLADPVDEVHLAAQAAKQMIAGLPATGVTDKEEILLSTIERIIFLKEVPFFQGMTIDQLKVLANVCEEELFEKDVRIFNEGEPGGVLYVVVSGRVAIEREARRKGSFARLATIEAHSYFGEMSLFDNSPHSAMATAIQDTLTLQLRREPLIALARQHPDLSLELINVLSGRLREANDRIAELTRTRPRELHKLFDKLE